jgi:hypothetical protein
VKTVGTTIGLLAVVAILLLIALWLATHLGVLGIFIGLVLLGLAWAFFKDAILTAFRGQGWQRK